MNLYYQMLDKIMSDGRTQTNKKGGIKYLTNEVLHLLQPICSTSSRHTALRVRSSKRS